jgi:hypothetical protein
LKFAKVGPGKTKKKSWKNHGIFSQKRCMKPCFKFNGFFNGSPKFKQKKVSIRLRPVMSNYLTNIYQTLRDHTKYFDITGLLPLMLCTAETTYEYELYSILLV